MQKLCFGLEVVEQTGGGDTGFGSDLRQSRIAPAVTGEQPLSDVENLSLALLAFDEESFVRPFACH
jgi:hypothetical protein